MSYVSQMYYKTPKSEYWKERQPGNFNCRTLLSSPELNGPREEVISPELRTEDTGEIRTRQAQTVEVGP